MCLHINARANTRAIFLNPKQPNYQTCRYVVLCPQTLCSSQGRIESSSRDYTGVLSVSEISGVRSVPVSSQPRGEQRPVDVQAGTRTLGSTCLVAGPRGHLHLLNNMARLGRPDFVTFRTRIDIYIMNRFG